MPPSTMYIKMPFEGRARPLASLAGAGELTVGCWGEQWLGLAEAQTEELGAGTAWEVGKSEQGTPQTEPGDARPPTGLLLCRVRRCKQLALPALLPQTQQPPGGKGGASSFRPWRSVLAQLLVLGHR